ncbi:uncharacterized protein LOC107431594 [Ziziphus jujuba]|uniref:Uncharacterized protein LOC107431594 n=1 Tax=Ziziphus jujuba TaxID=326968 RepID=A0A6P4BG32_ZIZJJ|nr:uncharacterized protein LOC107431594 [Ziziphus jujuba]
MSMGGWRRRQIESNDQDFHGTRSRYRRPSQESWRSTVPSWEKKFCASVGSVPWRKLLETKKYLYLYDNVIKWDDSAGEEAFINAKNRFWAEINGFPCNISLPDPNIYIDDVDWNSSIDPDLLMDLEIEPEPSIDKNEDENVVILDSPLLPNQQFSCSGWGESDEDFRKATDLCRNPRYGDYGWNVDDNKNSWEQNWTDHNEVVKDKGRSYHRNQWETNFNEWDRNYNGAKNVYGERADRDFQPTWGGNSWKKDCTGWYDSRYKTSRFHGKTDHGWRQRKKEESKFCI